MSPIASGDRGGVAQDKKPSQQQAAPTEVPETGTTRMHEMVLTRSRTKESRVAGDQLRKSCNAEPTPEELEADTAELLGEGGPAREELSVAQQTCPTLEGLRQQAVKQANGYVSDSHRVYWEDNLLYTEARDPKPGTARSSWDPERRGWQPKDKNTRTERRAEKRSTRIRSRLRKRRDAGSAAEKRRRRKRDRRIDARSRRNDAQHR
ncbi:hypothetical protein NDU88_007151 [Pleurodeles waltl]|uniref:Uncharacterized protein n=1 Tax=Pleurodeles waltl TaxID=8319 RepID=A0AAV7WCN2_PLEWA|nr:hypothetical protein NDU88_007151 [Pleurodeles waltl]